MSVEVRCFHCDHNQVLRKKSVTSNYQYWHCNVCNWFNLLPPQYRGEVDNRNLGYKKNQLWFKENKTSPMIRIESGKSVGK